MTEDIIIFDPLGELQKLVDELEQEENDNGLRTQKHQIG